ncbi:MAG: deoxyguanosinetriphosphate triphosphohydrolase [Sedimentisphaerales bacterium]|nr:deoxyguanosinetriphosphate triphosphohydrolase [Sedimentisphaerales bacterium]
MNCYAVTENTSCGRAFQEKPHPYRSGFERDRDRIIHCTAFRRLEGKTQVFTPGLDDYYRTRLTHSIEVAQIGRTIAKALGLNESLTEAICLAHDLGHSPFGHSGEKVLDTLARDFGGFEHNWQGLRVVDFLEHPYPDFYGLNLMYETRLGLAKHHSPYDKPRGNDFQEQNCSLEGQVANIADRIAISSHDLEDGMRAGLIDSNSLSDLSIVRQAQQQIDSATINDTSIRKTRTAKAIIDRLVSDCISSSSQILAKAQIKSVDEVYRHSDDFIVLSEEEKKGIIDLESFLFENLYEHKSLQETNKKVKGWLEQLFEQLCARPEHMPEHFQDLGAKQGLQRTVCDYIAGMTDRYCLLMLERGL